MKSVFFQFFFGFIFCFFSVDVCAQAFEWERIEADIAWLTQGQKDGVVRFFQAPSGHDKVGYYHKDGETYVKIFSSDGIALVRIEETQACRRSVSFHAEMFQLNETQILGVIKGLISVQKHRHYLSVTGVAWHDRAECMHTESFFDPFGDQKEVIFRFDETHEGKGGMQ